MKLSKLFQAYNVIDKIIEDEITSYINKARCEVEKVEKVDFKLFVLNRSKHCANLGLYSGKTDIAKATIEFKKSKIKLTAPISYKKYYAIRKGIKDNYKVNGWASECSSFAKDEYILEKEWIDSFEDCAYFLDNFNFLYNDFTDDKLNENIPQILKEIASKYDLEYISANSTVNNLEIKTNTLVNKNAEKFEVKIKDRLLEINGKAYSEVAYTHDLRSFKSLGIISSLKTAKVF